MQYLVRGQEFFFYALAARSRTRDTTLRSTDFMWPSSDRTVWKKTEKLIACTRELQQEAADIDARRRSEKRASRDLADDNKVEFLRVAAGMRRKIDENSVKAIQLQRTSAADMPDLVDLRQRMSEQLEHQRTRRRIVECENKAKLAVLKEEINHIYFAE